MKRSCLILGVLLTSQMNTSIQLNIDQALSFARRGRTVRLLSSIRFAYP